MLVEAFGEQVPTVKTCERWFQRFKSGDFDVDDKEHGKPPKRFEDAELQALLDEDDAQTQKQLAEQLEVSQQAVSNRLREKKRPEYQKRQHKVIFLHDNAPSHTARAVRDTLETLNWEVLPHAAYSPDLAPSDYHLFASMGHALAEQRFDSYESVKKWLDEWFAAKDDEFYWRGIHKLPERWEKCVASDGKYFE